MPNLNKVLLMGYVGRDVEVKFMQSGDAVANVGLATTTSWKDKSSGEKKEKTTWHNLVFYRQTAEIAGKYVKKGDPIYVEGSIENREYEKEGVKRSITEIIVDRMQLLGSKKDREPEAPQQSRKQGTGKPNTFDDFESDLPFD